MLEVNEAALQAALDRIDRGAYLPTTTSWVEDPRPDEVADYISRYGWDAYASWFLAIDPEADEYSLRRYRMPYGNLEQVSLGHLQSAQEEAYRYGDSHLEHSVSRILYRLDED